MKIIIPITIFPPTTKSPKAEIMELTASGPLCPSLKIDLVVAIFKESLNSAKIRIIVGKVVKSAGFCMYKDINRIKRDKDKDIIKKKSSIPFDKGTIIIVRIATNSPTTNKSFVNIFFRFIYYLIYKMP
jgi:hypothetical protein